MSSSTAQTQSLSVEDILATVLVWKCLLRLCTSLKGREKNKYFESVKPSPLPKMQLANKTK